MDLIDFLWLTVPAYIIVQIVALCWSSGRSRFAAALPLVVMIPIGVITVVDLSQGSNIWPLLLLVHSPLALLYIVVVAFFIRPGAKHSPPMT